MKKATGTSHLQKRFSVALAFSGGAALIYQVAWQRMMTQIIGSDAISMVLVVTIFMVCLGIGSELARVLVSRSQAGALRLYAIIETLVAAYGIFSIPLIRYVNDVAAPITNGSLAADFALNLGLMALPVIGMGLTAPLIVHVVKESLSNVGRTVGALYGWNIAGAAIGSILTGLILIEAAGLTGATYFAATANIIACLIAVNSIKLIKNEKSDRVNNSGCLLNIPKSVAVAAILFGFGTLALQVIFFRVLSNYMTLSTIVFPVLLCAYLCLMSAGQWIGGQLADRYSVRLPEVIAALFAIGAVLLLGALRLPAEWAVAAHGLRFSSFNGQLIAPEHRHLIGDPSPITVFLFSTGMMLSVVAWSGLFPVMFRLATRRIEDAGSRFARIYTLYTTGNVIGTFACGVFMLEAIGTGGSAIATIGVVAFGVVCIVLGQKLSKFILITLAVGFFSATKIPLSYYMGFELDDYRVIDVFEGKTGVATVVPTNHFYTIIDINRTASASALKENPGSKDDYEAWRWNHTELMALDPEFRPKNVLVIGIGHAYLIDAMLDLPFIEKITVVDLSEEVVSAVKKYTKTSAKRIFSDPRVSIVIADGRRFVQSALLQGERYDLIQNKINEPWHAGGGNLFTEEFFLEEKNLLSPGGYLSTRPLSGHLNDGFKIFGNALWGGYYHMYFKNGNFVLPEKAIITRDIRDAWLTEIPGEGAVENARTPEIEAVFFTEIPEHLKVDANTDDRPTFEYYWLRQLLGTWKSPRLQFWDLDLEKYKTVVPTVFE
ncbi:hypothetical protein [Castellaniella ginsengisoli]|uniref:Spermidine synthase n=1 Tax=Castellaniella ginsengisoli TaxID=546114 RepID=A0AB39CK64_9BURK